MGTTRGEYLRVLECIRGEVRKLVVLAQGRLGVWISGGGEDAFGCFIRDV